MLQEALDGAQICVTMLGACVLVHARVGMRSGTEPIWVNKHGWCPWLWTAMDSIQPPW